MVVGGTVKFPSKLNLAGFDGNAVIAHGKAATDNTDTVTGFRINGVRVRAVLRRGDQQVVHRNIL